MGKIKLYMVSMCPVDSDTDTFIDNLCTIVRSKKEITEYVYNSLLNYISYSEFIANGIQPIERPVNVSIKGTKTLVY